MKKMSDAKAFEDRLQDLELLLGDEKTLDLFTQVYEDLLNELRTDLDVASNIQDVAAIISRGNQLQILLRTEIAFIRKMRTAAMREASEDA
jgi:hypothetical protein